MSHGLDDIVHGGLRALVNSLGSNDQPSRHEELLNALATASELLSMVDLSEVVKLAADQRGRWEARRLFSSSAAPDTDAASEAEGWGALWDASAKELTLKVPDVSDQIRRVKELAPLQYCGMKALEQTRDRPLVRAVRSAQWQLATLLNRIGLKDIAQEPWVLVPSTLAAPWVVPSQRSEFRRHD